MRKLVSLFQLAADVSLNMMPVVEEAPFCYLENKHFEKKKMRSQMIGTSRKLKERVSHYMKGFPKR